LSLKPAGPEAISAALWTADPANTATDDNDERQGDPGDHAEN
jgi:hypothetical protein